MQVGRFPSGEDTCRTPACYWVPTENAELRARGDRVPYPQRIAEGHITASSGNAIDYSFVHHGLIEVSKLYKLKELESDPWNATHSPASSTRRMGSRRL